MSSSWTDCSIGDLVVLQRGIDLPTRERQPGSVPVMGSAGVTGHHDRVAARGPGVVIGRSGVGAMGVVSFIEGDYWPLNTTLYVKDFRGNDPRFIYYLFRTINFRQFDTGSAQSSLNRNVVYPYVVRAPRSARVQRAIASVLTEIEYRIDLLRETNATLEAIAQALFKSWFVDFDPVRAKQQGLAPAGMDEATAALFPDSFEESALGLVPKGWRHVSLREVVAIFDSRRIPLSGQERATRQGPFPYYGAAALMDHVDGYLFDGVHLLTGEDGSVADESGRPITQYVWGKFWVNNHAHVLQGKAAVSTEHVMLALRQTNIQPFITGAVQAKLSQANMWRIAFLMPSTQVAEAFGQAIEPLYARYRQNADQVRRKVEKGSFGNFAELRAVFPAVDKVAERFVFNIGGNKYRLVAGVDFAHRRVFIKAVLTHGEYDKENWK